MPDLETSLPLILNKAKRQRRIQKHNRIVRNHGFCFGTTGFPVSFDFRPVTLTQPPNKGVFTKRIKRISRIDFLSGDRFQIRKGAICLREKNVFLQNESPGCQRHRPGRPGAEVPEPDDYLLATSGCIMSSSSCAEENAPTLTRLTRPSLPMITLCGM